MAAVAVACKKITKKVTGKLVFDFSRLSPDHPACGPRIEAQFEVPEKACMPGSDFHRAYRHLLYGTPLNEAYVEETT